MMSEPKKEKNTAFFQRQRNTIVALAIVAAVLLAGYFIVRGALSEAPAESSAPPAVDLLPGEVVENGALMIYPSLERTDLKTVKIHNPKNKEAGDAYVDWGLGFVYDDKQKDSYAYMLNYDYASIDSDMLAYFCAAVASPVIGSRVEDHCTDFSPYGLDGAEEDLLHLTIEANDGAVYKLFIGDVNPGGNGYYVRSGDMVTDKDGKTYVRDSVYLLNAASSSYFRSTVAATPMAMLETLMTYPIASSFSSFALMSADETLSVSFLPVETLQNPADIFAGSNLYRAVTPAGFFSSSQFETRITRFEDFRAEEIMEMATLQGTGTDEDGEYTYYYFPDEVLEKYGLDSRHIRYFLLYSALHQESKEHVLSEVYFSDLQSDGYYYAYSLCFNTICRVKPETVDFLTWSNEDFIDRYALRMSIGYCKKLSVQGTLNGQPLNLSFTATLAQETEGTGYRLTGAVCDQTGKTLKLENYRNLFRVFYTTYTRGSVPSDLDKEKLMEGEPYFSFTVETPSVTVYEQDASGKNTNKILRVIPSVTRITRFYRYSNDRALMTVEMIDSEGKSSGESGEFYVSVIRLNKLLQDTKNVSENLPVDYYGRE